MTPRTLLGIGDLWVLVAALALTTLGGVVVQAVSVDPALEPGLSAEAARVALYAAVGVVAMLIAARLDHHLLLRLSPVVYLGGLGALALVFVIGSAEYGSRRWIDVGVTTVQPSEFAKVGLVVGVAALASARPPGPRAVGLSLLLLAGPLGLVLLQPDLGTSLVLVCMWLAMAVAWGTPWRLLGGLTVTAVAVLPLLFAIAVPDYQRERLAVFFDPTRDPLGSGFQLRQVEAALGAGGTTGIGPFSDHGSALLGLSTRTSDFAFAQVGEFFGLVGALAVIVLYLLVAWRGITAASGAPDTFGRVLAVGLTSMLVAQAMLHIAVNLRLFPATGIALPFISQGGSALVAMFVAVGILQGIALQRPSRPRGQQWRDWRG